jgi:hypothetical protein
MPHALDRDRDDVDLALLNVELSERLGRPVVPSFLRDSQ